MTPTPPNAAVPAQPDALRLAEALEQQFPSGTAQAYLDGEAAAELRRLHAKVTAATQPLAILRREIGESSWFDHKPVRPGSAEHRALERSAEWDCCPVHATESQGAAERAVPADALTLLRDMRNWYRDHQAIHYQPLLGKVDALLTSSPAQPAPEPGPAVPNMTADEVKALPNAARAYIHQLAANTDPAGMVRENMQLRDANAGLQSMYRKAADALQEVVGCFDAADGEGLSAALAETTDERLKDLVERRLMYALYAAQDVATHVQKPAENEHVDADVSKNQQVSNMTAPAQDGERCSFGGPELQAMIVARAVEKDRAARAPAGAAGGVHALPDENTCVNYALRYGGTCRDCADENGVCPNSGLPCGSAHKAVTHVVQALRYGLQHGYLRAPQPPAPAATTSDAPLAWRWKRRHSDKWTYAEWDKLEADAAAEMREKGYYAVELLSAFTAAPAATADALTVEDAELLQKAVTDFEECGETDVPDAALRRFAAAGYLECVHYHVMPNAQEAIDATLASNREVKP